MDYLEFIAQLRSRIPEKGEAFPLRIVDKEPRRVPAKGWAEMVRKVCEVEPLRCPRPLSTRP